MGVVVKIESLVLDKSKIQGNVKLAEENGGSRVEMMGIAWLGLESDSRSSPLGMT